MGTVTELRSLRKPGRVTMVRDSNWSAPVVQLPGTHRIPLSDTSIRQVRHCRVEGCDGAVDGETIARQRCPKCGETIY